MPLLPVLLAACGRPLPDGAWTLHGQGLLGEVTVERGEARVAVWGDGWGAPSAVPATVEAAEEGGAWLSFPVRTGAGEATGVMRLDPEDESGVLPLGGRPGEIDLAFEASARALSEAERAQEARTLEERLVVLRAAWKDGRFRILDLGGGLVGQVALLPQDRAFLDLFALQASSGGPVPARRRDEGPDVVLTFPVQPALGGEEGLLRLNVPTGRAVLPMADRPSADDLWFHLEPGTASAEERDARAAEAERRALERERAFLDEVAVGLARDARERRAAAAACPAFDEMGPSWALLFADYEVEIETRDAACAAHLRPRRPQFSRRTGGTALSDGSTRWQVVEE